MFNSWDRQPLLYTDESGGVSIVPKMHQLRRNFIFNANFAAGGMNSGYCIDMDDASSEYNATGNVLVFGGFKLSDGSNRSVSGNLVVDGKLVDPQQAGCCPTPALRAGVLSINTTSVFGNTAVQSQGGFYSCAGPLPIAWWASHGNRFYDNTFYTPGSPSLPFKPSGCNTSGTTLAQWQAHGAYFDRGSTISSDITVAQLLTLARGKLGMELNAMPGADHSSGHGGGASCGTLAGWNFVPVTPNSSLPDQQATSTGDCCAACRATPRCASFITYMRAALCCAQH
jgi:hypothetical protein